MLDIIAFRSQMETHATAPRDGSYPDIVAGICRAYLADNTEF